MTKKEITINAIAALEGLYPDAICSLEYTDAFQLLIATRLSAQCTDARVNMVTPALFNRYPDAKSMAVAEISDVEELIKTCGLYKTKARDLVGIAQKIVTDFGGNVPDTIEALTTLPGVGRKTANLVCGDIYGKPAVVTDTHFIRLCNRLGLVKTTNPLQVEMAMRKLLPPEKSNDFCHRSVLFGRDICTARKAYCERCPLNSFCPKKIDKK
ncbi:MAG: endonuclease III [Clostridia bacterium]|nr:endonuclease III [Clostridia bacterium]